MTETLQGAGEGPGEGERSEPQPGPSPARRLGVGTGKTKRYTPEERRWALEAWERSGLGAAMFARQWGLSTPTLYEWKRAVARGGPQALEHPCASSTGRSRGAQPIAPAVAEEIVKTKREFPDFGLRKVRDYVARFVGLRVSTGGVRAVLARAGVEPTAVPKRRGRGRPAIRRFERAHPGELWQSDITSYVLARQSTRVYLIVFLDDHSRYVVSWGLFLRQTGAISMETLLDGIQRYGKPKEVLTDQGRQYFAWRGKTGFQQLLAKEGIAHVVARTHHPQTLGKCERLWETVGRELWDRAHPQDLAEARERLGHYFNHYNHFRPHQGLGGMVPADRFFSSEPAVRKAMEAAIDTNELRLALGEKPRRPVYLVGQVDGEAVSLHGERGRLVMTTRDGVRNMGIDELGMHTEVNGGAHGNDGSSNGSDGDSRRDGCGPKDAAASPDGGRLPAPGLPDQRDPGVGDEGRAADGADALRRDPGILAGPREQGGAGEASGDAADPRVAALAAGYVGNGGGDAASADREARSDAETRSGGQGPEEARRGAGGGDGPAAAADRAAPDDAGQRAPRAPEGDAGCREDQAAAAQGEGGTQRCATWSWNCTGDIFCGAVTTDGSPGRSA